jgi:hypothetical protein
VTSGKVAGPAGRLAALARGLPGRLAAHAAAVVRPVLRRLPAAVIGLAVTLTALGLLALVAARLDDAAIDANRGVAVADVLDGSGDLQTGVRFITADGRVVAPETGAAYPGELQPGEKVLVEYDQREPERVRIAGRGGAVGIGPIAVGVLIVWLVALPLAAWLRRQRFARPVEPAESGANPG